MFALRDVRTGVFVGSYISFFAYVVMDLADKWGWLSLGRQMKDDIDGLMLFCFVCVVGLFVVEVYVFFKLLLKSFLKNREEERDKSHLKDSIDPEGVFCCVKNSEVAMYQSCFEFFAEEFDLDSKGDGESLSDDDVACVIQQVEAVRERGVVISFAYIMVLIEQYIDADPLQRQMYKARWLEASVEIQSSDYSFMPPPGPVLKSVMDRYFPKD